MKKVSKKRLKMSKNHRKCRKIAKYWHKRQETVKIPIKKSKNCQTNQKIVENNFKMSKKRKKGSKLRK